MTDSVADRDGASRLLLIDGHALVFRAFYALQNERPLTSPSGELTTGVYGFTSMLLKALDTLDPQYVAAAFDMPAPTFRSGEFEAYKATRKAAPPEIRGQVALTGKVLDAMQVPIYRLEGFEADDVIGTLARQATAAGLEVVVLTGDNDLLQLVDGSVKVMTSRRGISDTVLYDETGVEEKYGLKPEQIPDFKALRGDTSDNIPSVPGIGDKTAQKLLAENGTVEKLYEHLDSLPEKQRGLLAPYAEQVRMAKRLATIVCDAPVQLDVEAARLSDVRRPEVLTAFQELGFKSLVDRLPRAGDAGEAAGQLGLFGAESGPAATSKATSARVIESLEELERLVGELRQHGSFAFDVQATGTLPMAARTVGV